VKFYGFLIQIEVEDGVDANKLALKLADACSFVEGVGKTEVEFMGVIDQYEEEEGVSE